MKHIHLFHHIGGGCSLGQAVKNEDAQCDDHYKCECGAEFRTTSNINTHYTMPHYIAGKEEPEVIDLVDEEIEEIPQFEGTKKALDALTILPS